MILDQPAIIKGYNESMGGVDLVDRALSDLRPQIQGKKWYWALLINAINLLFVFSWRLYEIANNEKMEQREFRREIVNILLNLDAVIPTGESRSGPSSSVPKPVRYDNKGHYPENCHVRKCVVCKKSARIQCSKCKKTLHLSMRFQVFHEEE